ncbi:MAG: polysaccharide biosynthesis protein [Candidatus Azobacteroides sp.]|nr:polysaccharide biosynthesis protein [Candidatus Azobacteroides sp.]
MAIPKKIHWCWLSGEPLPKHIQQCINSWKKIMPDYEVILWDKNRFNIRSVQFVEEACKAHKWAFAADYIRLYALYTEGGIYLDSDVMVFRRLDTFLNHSAFSSIEYIPKHVLLRNENNPYCGYAIQAAIMGAEKGNEWIKKTKDFYEQEMVFKMKEDGITDMEVIPDVLARYAHLYFGFQYDKPFNAPQYLKDNIVIYPPKVFTATYGETDMHTYAIHIGDGSWAGDKQKWFADQELKMKKWYKTLCYSSRFFNMLHWKRKQLEKKIKK